MQAPSEHMSQLAKEIKQDNSLDTTVSEEGYSYLGGVSYYTDPKQGYLEAMLSDKIEFKEVAIDDPVTKQMKGDAIAVIRNGCQVALLPEADRLRRALGLPLEEIEHIVNNFTSIMKREPSGDEKEFWKAVLDFKRSQS